MNQTKLKEKIEPKFNDELKNIKQELGILRSAIISIVGKDKEGRYRPELVKEIIDTAKEKPEFVFKNAETFLSQIDSNTIQLLKAAHRKDIYK